MKHSLWSVLIVSFVLPWMCHTFADAQTSVNEALRQQSIKYAIFQAAQEVVNTAENMTIPNIVERSAKQISSDIETHQKVANSKQTMESYVKKSFDESLDQKLEAVFQSLKLENLSLGSQKTNLKQEMKTVYRDVIDEQKSTYMSTHFNRIFQTSRKKAVEDQLSTLLMNAYPDQNDVVAVDRANWADAPLAQLKQRVMDNIQGRTTHLFEENQITVSDQATLILSKVRAQLDQQRTALNMDIAPHLVTKKQIATGLLDNLDQAIKKMKYETKTGEKIYEPFPSVLQSIDQQAQQTEKERFLQAFADTPLAFDEERIRQLISENLSDNKTRDQSAQFLGQRVYVQQLTHVVNQYATQSPASEVNEFKQRLQTIINNDSTMQDRLKIAIINQLKGSLAFKIIRDRIAQLQVKQHFVPVHDGSWTVPGPSLEKMSHTPGNETFGGVESIDRALALPHISKRSIPFQRNALLEETEEDFLTRIQKLLAEGKRAWDRQFQLVRAHERTIKEEWAKNHKTLPDLAADSEDFWVERYTKDVESQWREQRVQLLWRGVANPPPYMATKYSPLFGYMKDEIRKIVHSYFENQKQELILVYKGGETSIPSSPPTQKIPEPMTHSDVQQAPLSPASKTSSQQQEKPVSDEATSSHTPSTAGANAGPGSGLNPQDGVTGRGQQSVESEEKSNRGDQPSPSEGGTLRELPWWWSWLLLLLILLLVALTVLLVRVYRRYRAAAGTIEMRVKNLDEAVDMFTPIIGQAPIQQTDQMAIYQQVNGSKIIFVRE